MYIQVVQRHLSFQFGHGLQFTALTLCGKLPSRHKFCHPFSIPGTNFFFFFVIQFIVFWGRAPCKTKRTFLLSTMLFSIFSLCLSPLVHHRRSPGHVRACVNGVGVSLRRAPPSSLLLFYFLPKYCEVTESFCKSSRVMLVFEQWCHRCLFAE